jgi:predicted O-linked N-acetylglucosamine transferase (SPINDLY family)
MKTPTMTETEILKYRKKTNIITKIVNESFHGKDWNMCITYINKLLTMDKTLFNLDNVHFMMGLCYINLNNMDKALDFYKKVTSAQNMHRIGAICSKHNLFKPWMYDKPLIIGIIMSDANFITSKWKSRPNTFWEPLYKIMDILGNENLFNGSGTEVVSKIECLIDQLKEKKIEVCKIHESPYYQKPLFYQLSYSGINCKNIMTKISDLIKPKSSIRNSITRYGNNNRIKVCFFSQFLSKFHSVFRDRSGIITNLPSNIFEKHIIVDRIVLPYPSSLHKKMYDSVDYVWEYTKIAPLDNFVTFMSRLNLDILVYCDIGMSPESIYFAHHRLAPIQINTWGHSLTSGIPNIDYFISSKYFEIYDAQAHYSEKLITMNSLSTYYPNIATALNLTKDELGLPMDRAIISCLQMPQKINIDFYKMMFQIWKQSKLKPVFLLMKIKQNKRQLKRQEVILSLFGNDFFSSIIYKDYLPTNKYIQHIRVCDLTIDPYPFGGCNCTLEAFTFNKLVISLPSKFLSGRFTKGFYDRMNKNNKVIVSWPIATDKQDYIEKCIYYLNNVDERKKIEISISENKHKLFTETESITEWTNTLLKLHHEL